MGPKLTHPVPVPMVRLFTCSDEVVMVEAKIELVKMAIVDKLLGILDKYSCPKFLTVDVRDVSKKGVETMVAKFAVDTNPDVCRPRVVETKEVVETYPVVPRPATVDVMLAILIPPGPKAVEKEDIAEFNVNVETYPAVPRPVTVDVIFPRVISPPPPPPPPTEPPFSVRVPLLTNKSC